MLEKSQKESNTLVLEQSRSENVVGKRARSKEAINWRLMRIAAISYLGGFNFGFSAQLIGSSFSQPQFAIFFPELSDGSTYATNMTALVSAIPNLGGVVGVIMGSYISNRFGRKWPFIVGALFSLLAAALSSGAQNLVMLIIGRLFQGWGGWMTTLAGITYVNELSPYTRRGDLAGPVGPFLNSGFTVAAWIQVGFFYVSSSFNWRGVLVISLFPPLLMLAWIPFMVESPRWLAFNGRGAEALEIFKHVHAYKDDPEQVIAREEHYQVMKQVHLDKQLESSWASMFGKYRKRTLCACLIAGENQATGPQVIINYSYKIYNEAGLLGVNAYLVGGGYYTLSFLGGLFWSQFIDKIGRRKMLNYGLLAACCSFCVILALFSVYVLGTIQVDNPAPGQKALIFAFFIYNFLYQINEPPMFVYICELFGTHIRTKGVALALISLTLTSFWVTMAFPPGLANCGWSFLLVYPAVMMAGFFLQLIFIRETKNIPLEEIARVYGAEDEVAVRSQEISEEVLAKEYGVERPV